MCRLFARVGAVVGLTVLSSCAGRSSESRQRVANEPITFDRYQTAFYGFRDCLAAAGMPLEGVRLDTQTMLWTFAVSAKAVNTGTTDKCEEAFAAADFAWQTSSARPKPEYQRFTGVQTLSACLKDAGEPVAAEASVDELMAQLGAVGIDMQDCIRTVQRLYP